MRRYDEDKKYKAVPHTPESLSEPFEKELWRAVCRQKIATEEGLKSSDLHDVLVYVVNSVIIARLKLTATQRRRVSDLIRYGKMAEEARECKKRLFGNEEAYIHIEQLNFK